MKIEVKMDAADAGQLVAAHLREKFKHLAGQGEWVSITRVGDLPQVSFTYSVEVKVSTSSTWD